MSKRQAPDVAKAHDAPPPTHAGASAATEPGAPESVAGEEDPGSALELFSDFMHDASPCAGAAHDVLTTPRLPQAGADRKAQDPGTVLPPGPRPRVKKAP